MNKTDLKNNWGMLCDTDKLVDEVMETLTKYRHRNSEHGVCTMLNEFFENKTKLITAMFNSEHYIGDLRIAIDIELIRDSVPNDVRKFCRDFLSDVGARKLLISKVNKEGKKQSDYLQTGIAKLTAKDLLNDDIKTTLTSFNDKANEFNDVGDYKPDVENCNNLQGFIQEALGRNYESTLSQNVVAASGRLTQQIRLAEGMKTSRAFNRMCNIYGIDKLDKYNKMFAEYADMVSGLKRKLKMFISVNPIDYLTMSFGENWASCHTIDTTNVRRLSNSYQGQYCGGTLSYMLDSTSIITYVHKDIPDDFVKQGKIYRNMFHYEDNLLVQGRVYPQGNDGKSDLYKVFRNYVQDELSEILGLENKTWVKKSGSPTDYIYSVGVHYRDYAYYNGCNVSHPKEMEMSDNRMVHIGSDGICPYCGDPISMAYKLSHDSCEIQVE